MCGCFLQISLSPFLKCKTSVISLPLLTMKLCLFFAHLVPFLCTWNPNVLNACLLSSRHTCSMRSSWVVSLAHRVLIHVLFADLSSLLSLLTMAQSLSLSQNEPSSTLSHFICNPTEIQGTRSPIAIVLASIEMDSIQIMGISAKRAYTVASNDRNAHLFIYLSPFAA
mmetsp:Transcript_53241/g.159395  ORF Transcript_53241/g.159395 Transcript_53241/m.159395 type:complete len:168 (+) Transcript_53241:1814-2317(+)